MREIKFRAWDKEYKEMINDIHIVPEYNWGVYSDNDNMCERERAEDGQIILMQYTGLKDKNNTGEELYADDVVYLAGYGNYRCVFPFIELYEAMAENDIGDKLGNIHERPELLKDSK